MRHDGGYRYWTRERAHFDAEAEVPSLTAAFRATFAELAQRNCRTFCVGDDTRSRVGNLGVSMEYIVNIGIKICAPFLLSHFNSRF